MTTEQKALLEIIMVGVTENCQVSVAVFDADWTTVFDLACKQGVTCIAWHGLEILYKNGINNCPQEVKLQWYATSKQIQRDMIEKKRVVVEFAEKMKPVEFAVLKGVDYSRYWPKAEYREFGDLDCVVVDESLEFRAENTKQLEEKALEIGCKVESDSYKHSHVYYGNLLIENHLVFSEFGGSKEGRLIEQELRRLFGKGVERESDTSLIMPNSDFTALFLIFHAQFHMFCEGITLRHLLDFYFFVNKSNVDWDSVNDVLESTNLKPFADISALVIEKYLGLKMPKYKTTEEFTDRELEAFVEDMFSEKRSESDRRIIPLLSRMANRFKRMYKFSRLMRMPLRKAVWTAVAYSSYLNRKPKL